MTPKYSFSVDVQSSESPGGLHKRHRPGKWGLRIAEHGAADATATTTAIRGNDEETTNADAATGAASTRPASSCPTSSCPTAATTTAGQVPEIRKRELNC